jgi:hypothetical protein
MMRPFRPHHASCRSATRDGLMLDLHDVPTGAALLSEYNALDQVVDHITPGTATATEESLSVDSPMATLLADRYRIVARVFRRALRGWDSPIAPTD